jgi:hypothetical protein
LASQLERTTFELLEREEALAEKERQVALQQERLELASKV